MEGSDRVSRREEGAAGAQPAVPPRRMSATAHCWDLPLPSAICWWTSMPTWPPVCKTCAAAPAAHVPRLPSIPASAPTPVAGRRTGGGPTSAVSNPAHRGHQRGTGGLLGGPQAQSPGLSIASPCSPHLPPQHSAPGVWLGLCQHLLQPPARPSLRGPLHRWLLLPPRQVPGSLRDTRGPGVGVCGETEVSCPHPQARCWMTLHTRAACA